MARQARFDLPVWISGAALLAVIALAARYERARPAGSARPFGERSASGVPLAIRRRRARQPGRGRNAVHPADIPGRGWKDIVWRCYGQVGEDRLLAVAAAVAFFGLLAIFPAITAFVSLYGLFAKAATINDHLSFIAGVLPASGYEIISAEIARIAAKSDGKLSVAFLTALAVALWSANAGMKAIIDALNVIYEEDEKRGFLHLNLLSLGLTLGAIVFLLAAIGVVVAFPVAMRWMGFESFAGTAVIVLRWPALFVVVVLGLQVLYRVGPSRREAKWRWLTPGSVLAALAWLGGSALFSWYLANVADYSATYGALGAAIGLMMWLWLTAVVVLLGAEFNAETEHQTAHDSTTGIEKPLGARGATMADTIGAAEA
ncbi:MAG: YihY/virulence factor BrkB family protein [Pseudorhodoplanes sp.]